jgi:hypothetical protein
VYIMIVLLVLLPFLYLRLPAGLVAALFGFVVFGALLTTLTPVMRGGYAAALVVTLTAADVAAYTAGWPVAMLVLNDLAVMILVVGVTNMWVQTGMTAGHIAWLAAALTVYDTLATGIGTVTADFVGRVIGLPFAPLLATRYGADPIILGMGDCLMLTVWPLVAAKTYGRVAGLLAAALDVVLFAAVMGAFFAGLLGRSLPLLTLLGPLIIAQYLFWRRRARRGVPGLGHARRDLADTLGAYGELARVGRPGTWVAVVGGRLVGTGTSPGTARRAARRAGVAPIPVTIRLPD